MSNAGPAFLPMLDTVPNGAIHIECIIHGPLETTTYIVRSKHAAAVTAPA